MRIDKNHSEKEASMKNFTNRRKMSKILISSMVGINFDRKINTE